jgi:alkylation response protein AidB-like acyl-CoA dehydrogenase
MGWGLAALNRVGGAALIDRLGLRRPVERAVFHATRTGFRAAAAANRTFQPAGDPGNGRATNASETNASDQRGTVDPIDRAVRLPAAAPADLFDLTPTEEQQLIAEATRDFATRRLRPAASEADLACQAPTDLLAQATAELGVRLLGVPENLGGLATERAAVTNVLVAEALAYGDLGLAVAILAPSAVSTAVALWGTAGQQAAYLPAFVADGSPDAALAVLEPRALFDPFRLETTARPTAGGYLLDGVKSLVPLAATAELFLVAAEITDRGPALFIVESAEAGLTVEAEPAMGLRAAGMGRLLLQGVTVGDSALLGDSARPSGPGRGETARAAYRECIRLSRLGWAALAVGTCQAMLDYVIDYVNSRSAFGEPISHRQAVAFLVADMAIELEGMRLATYRAAGRAEHGQPFARDAALARKLASEYGMKIGTDGVQLLGGHGYVKEHPVERWYRDLRSIGVMEGAVLV